MASSVKPLQKVQFPVGTVRKARLTSTLTLIQYVACQAKPKEEDGSTMDVMYEAGDREIMAPDLVRIDIRK